MKKRGFIFIFLIALILLAFLMGSFLPISQTGWVIDTNKEEETLISSKILEVLDSEESVKVIVTLKDSVEIKKGFLGLQSGTLPVSRQEIIEQKEISEKVRHRYQFSNSFSAELTMEEIEILRTDGRVKHISYDFSVRTFLQDSTELILANQTWVLQENGINLTGKGQTVCVIDTGVDYTHPDLGNCTEQEFLDGNCSKVIGGWDFFNSDPNPMDDNGHGTHVSGIIAANGLVKGVAPDSNIIAIKALNFEGGGSGSDVLAGIEWCINNATNFNISVISLSLGDNSSFWEYYCDNSLPSWEILIEAINIATEENISFVAATGNDNNATHITPPACIQNVIRVGSSTKLETISSFSNRWGLDMLLAPGSTINSTLWQGNYGPKSGTSMSTPHVSGAIAIINQYLALKGETMMPHEIFELLNSTSKQINDSSSGGSNLNYSRIDVYNSLITLDEIFENMGKINVTLIFPEDNNFTTINSMNFSCNASSKYELVNVTFFIFSLMEEYNHTEILTGKINSTTFNYTFPVEGTYFWTCLFYDEQGGGSYGEPFQLMYYENNISILEISPGEEWINQADFNVTIDRWGSCNLSFNEGTTNNTMNVVSFFGNASFRYLNKTHFEEEYHNPSYTIDFYCEDWVGYSTAFESVMFKVDLTKPLVELEYPLGESYERNISEGDGAIEINFTYNFTDNLEIIFCELIVGGEFIDNNQSLVLNNSINSIIFEFEEDSVYSWKINCTDEAGNIGSSSLGEFTIIVFDEEEGGNGSDENGNDFLNGEVIGDNGDGDNIVPTGDSNYENETEPESQTHYVSEVELIEGYSKLLKAGDKLVFEISEETHEVIIEEIGPNSASITLRSEPINFILIEEEERKFNVTSSKYYNLLIRLEEITNNQANITVVSIHEKISSGIGINTATLLFVILVIVLVGGIVVIGHFFLKHQRESKGKNKLNILRS